jgi:hypothetical protein
MTETKKDMNAIMYILRNYLNICIPDRSTPKIHSYQIHDRDEISPAEVRTCKRPFSLYENNAKPCDEFYFGIRYLEGLPTCMVIFLAPQRR